LFGILQRFDLFSLQGGVKGDNATAFNCTAICPPDVPHKIFPQDSNDEAYCSIEAVGQVSMLLVQFSYFFAC
jgi:hypothetical protein